jgi:hypothetical protein
VEVLFFLRSDLGRFRISVMFRVSSRVKVADAEIHFEIVCGMAGL